MVHIMYELLKELVYKCIRATGYVLVYQHGKSAP